MESFLNESLISGSENILRKINIPLSGHFGTAKLHSSFLKTHSPNKKCQITLRMAIQLRTPSLRDSSNTEHIKNIKLLIREEALLIKENLCLRVFSVSSFLLSKETTKKP